MIDSTWDFQDRVRIVNFHENIFYKLSMFSFKTVNIVFSTCNTNSIHANWVIVNQLFHLFVSHAWSKSFFGRFSEFQNFSMSETWHRSFLSLKSLVWSGDPLFKESRMLNFVFIDDRCGEQIELIHIKGICRNFIFENATPIYNKCWRFYHEHTKQGREPHIQILSSTDYQDFINLEVVDLNLIISKTRDFKYKMLQPKFFASLF